MHTLFELNTKIDVDEAAFERMMNAAEAELSKAEKSQYIQAIVLLSVKGNKTQPRQTLKNLSGLSLCFMRIKFIPLRTVEDACPYSFANFLMRRSFCSPFLVFVRFIIARTNDKRVANDFRVKGDLDPIRMTLAASGGKAKIFCVKKAISHKKMNNYENIH